MNEYSPTFVAKQIVDRLRGAIAQHSISQIELAILCDVSQSQFSKIIRGVRPMTVDQLVVIAEALGIDLGALVTKSMDTASAADRLSSPVVYVEDGITLDKPYVLGGSFLDVYGTRALARISALSDLTPTVAGDGMDIADVHSRDEGVKHVFGLAAKKGVRAADRERHAD